MDAAWIRCGAQCPQVSGFRALAGVTSGGTAGSPDGPAPGTAVTGSGGTGRDERGPVPAPRSGGPADGQGRGVLAPWVAVSCRIAMGVTMAFMLVIMI